MTYIKHPEHGNKHVSAEEAEQLVAEGWEIWPRSKEAKAGIVMYKLTPSEVQPDPSVFIRPAILTEPAPVKRAYVRKVK